MTKHFFIFSIFIISCGQSVNHRASISEKKVNISTDDNLSPIQSMEPNGLIVIRDSKLNSIRIKEHFDFSNPTLLDSLSEPKAYLYNSGTNLFLTVFSKSKWDTIGLSISDVEVNFKSGHLESLQLNNKGSKEIIINTRSEWFLTYYNGESRSISYSEKEIWDIDKFSPLFIAYYKNKEYSAETENNPDYQYDVDISEKEIILKNYLGHSKPDNKMGRYVWQDTAFFWQH